MANVLFKRGNTATINGTAISDGQLLYNTTTGQQYIDSGSTRKEVGKPVDTALSTTSTNAIANNALTNSIINTTAEVSAITADNIPCGTKPVKELITSLNGLGNYDLYRTTSNSPTNQVTVDLTKYRYVALFPGVGETETMQNIGYVPTGLFKEKVLFQQFRNDSMYAVASYIDDNTIKLYHVNCNSANFVGIK